MAIASRTRRRKTTMNTSTRSSWKTMSSATSQKLHQAKLFASAAKQTWGLSAKNQQADLLGTAHESWLRVRPTSSTKDQCTKYRRSNKRVKARRWSRLWLMGIGIGLIATYSLFYFGSLFFSDENPNLLFSNVYSYFSSILTIKFRLFKTSVVVSTWSSFSSSKSFLQKVLRMRCIDENTWPRKPGGNSYFQS